MKTHTAHTCLQKAVFVFLWATLAWLAWPDFMTALADTSPRQRIQNLSRFVWKQATVASELWEKLTARCVDQHRHIERTLEQLLEIQGAMEELNATLTQAEGVRATWEPIGDLFIDSLPEHIQALKVCRPSSLATQRPDTPPRPWQCSWCWGSIVTLDFNRVSPSFSAGSGGWFSWGLPWLGKGFPGDSDGKESPCNAGDLGLIPGLGRSPGEGHDNPLQYPCLKNHMDRGAWWVAVLGVTKSQTWLNE